MGCVLLQARYPCRQLRDRRKSAGHFQSQAPHLVRCRAKLLMPMAQRGTSRTAFGAGTVKSFTGNVSERERETGAGVEDGKREREIRVARWTTTLASKVNVSSLNEL